MIIIDLTPMEDRSWWSVVVGGDFVVASVACRHMGERIAKKLAEARDTSERNAMRLMVEDIGMCEDFARALYLRLQQPVDGDTIN